ncbi:hypothetical protein KP509_38G040400 [Ceratopteris richardii]|uniref:Uncharacterized protein n=1 Tax=Ceratopteris richardii TaxID=49495 RepID=A0A8T2Q429_CERRI|nr:hypothetical protein KP509_38G040400 [Ceratopteris richardii]
MRLLKFLVFVKLLICTSIVLMMLRFAVELQGTFWRGDQDSGATNGLLNQVGYRRLLCSFLTNTKAERAHGDSSLENLKKNIGTIMAMQQSTFQIDYTSHATHPPKNN